jgi:hypothetical protein
MATQQLAPTAPDLIFHLQYVVNRVRHNLLTANLHEVANDTGISYSNVCRIRAGGVPSLPTLEMLAYYFSPKPTPKPLDPEKLKKLPFDIHEKPLPPIDEAPWIMP